jgi:cell division transport system permease protein
MATVDIDLPLAATPASRFMTWIVGALVYLAILAFGLAAVADGRIAAAAREPRMVSVSLPPPLDPAAGEAETLRVLEQLRALPGIAFAQRISSEEMGELVGPWLGDLKELGSLPLPRLIDVGYNPGIEPDVGGIEARLATILSGAAAEAVPSPSAEIARTARLLRGLGVGLGLFLLLAGVAVVVVVTRLSLDMHDETVDLLRLMGAADSYVARQFERHALSSGLRGGSAGSLLAVLTLIGTAWGLGHLADIPAHDLRPVDWVLLACVPVVGVLAATLAARVTASRSLAQIH